MLRKRILGIILISSFVYSALAIQCYQCGPETNADPNAIKDDKCGSYSKFDVDLHVPVECGSDEAATPGTFCMKTVQQGPKGFLWDGRWRQVIRSCASVSDTGVTGVCNWGVKENGDYWEVCYCSEDGCNSAENIYFSFKIILISYLSIYLFR